MTNPTDVPAVYEFTHFDKHYRIVRMNDFNWRAAFGFKPDWPYILIDSKGYSVNGVSESNLVWYRSNR